jgi:hypothetical protein
MYDRFWKKNKQAVTSVVSMILVMMIFFISVGIIFFWGLPAIDNAKSNVQKESSLNNLDVIDNSIEEVLIEGIGSVQHASISNTDSFEEFYVDEEGDRFVTMYARNPSFNLNVSGLDDSNESFKVHATRHGSQIKVENVTMHWMNETCFLAGTQVLMADGSYKNIETINIGESVKSYNFKSKKVGDYKVTNVFHHNKNEMNSYYLKINNFLKVTPNHRFYSDNKWVYADHLEIGDFLFTENKEEFEIKSIEKIYEKQESYDLTVEKNHNYFVSISEKNSVLVHNTEQTYVCDGKDARAYEGADLDGVFRDLAENEFAGAVMPTDYSLIDGDDDNYVEDINGVDVDEYQYHRFDFTIDEDVSSITQVDITWKGIGGDSFGHTGHSLWVRNGASYVEQDSGISSAKETLTASFSNKEEITEMLKNKHLYFAAQSDWMYFKGYSSILRSYYVEVVITYTSAANEPPIEPYSPDPANGEADVDVDDNLIWSGGDNDGDSVDYDIYLLGPFTGNDEEAAKVLTEKIDAGDTTGTTADTTEFEPGRLEYSGKYYWQINASDGTDYSLGPMWNFTTAAETGLEPHEPICVQPLDDSYDVNLSPIFKVTVSDPNARPMDVDFYWANGTLIDSVNSVNSGDSAELDPGLSLNYGKEYQWYVIANNTDGYDTQSDIWGFGTIEAPILNASSTPKLLDGCRELYNKTTYRFKVEGEEPGLKYGWDWDGDKQVDEWKDAGPTGISQSVTTAHSWDKPGVYLVRVKTRTTDGVRVSDWSDPLAVQIYEKDVKPRGHSVSLSSRTNPPQIIVGEMNSPQLIKINDAVVPPSRLEIKGTMVIKLFNDSYPTSNPGNVSFGVIYVFDLGSLVQISQTSVGEYKNILENDALINSKPDGYMWMDSSFLEVLDSSSIKIVKICSDNAGGGAGKGIFRFEIEMNDLFILDNGQREAYNLKMQVFGENQDVWLDYLKSDFNNQAITSNAPDKTIVYKECSKKYFTVEVAVIKINLEAIT